MDFSLRVSLPLMSDRLDLPWRELLATLTEMLIKVGIKSLWVAFLTIKMKNYTIIGMEFLNQWSVKKAFRYNGFQKRHSNFLWSSQGGFTVSLQSLKVNKTRETRVLSRPAIWWIHLSKMLWVSPSISVEYLSQAPQKC